MENRKNTELYWEQIDVYEIIERLWTARKRIILSCVIGAIVGLLIAFSIPATYRSKMSFAPETKVNVGSGVSSIASMMGVSLDNSVDAISVDMFPDVIYSTPFIFNLFSLPIETNDGLQTNFLDYMKNHQKKAWWSYILEAPFKALYWVMNVGKEDEEQLELSELDIRTLPKLERLVIKSFPEVARVDVNKKTGKVDIAVVMQDPYVAATVLDAIVKNLEDYMVQYRTSKVRKDVENLEAIFEQRRAEYYAAQKVYAEFSDANKNIVMQYVQAEKQKLQQEMNLAYQVYSQVATQLEAARIKEQESKPVFFVIEPVSVPTRKHAPSKAKLLVIFAFLGVMSSMAWELLGKDVYKKFIKISRS